MRLLCNSAVIAQNNDGTYTYTTISREQAIAWLKAYPFQSRVGYPATAHFVQRIAGVRVSLNRDPSWLDLGDEALVVRPVYRLQDPKQKRDWTPADEDYTFGILRRIE